MQTITSRPPGLRSFWIRSVAADLHAGRLDGYGAMVVLADRATRHAPASVRLRVLAVVDDLAEHDPLISAALRRLDRLAALKEEAPLDTPYEKRSVLIAEPADLTRARLVAAFARRTWRVHRVLDAEAAMAVLRTESIDAMLVSEGLGDDAMRLLDFAAQAIPGVARILIDVEDAETVQTAEDGAIPRRERADEIASSVTAIVDHDP